MSTEFGMHIQPHDNFDLPPHLINPDNLIDWIDNTDKSDISVPENYNVSSDADFLRISYNLDQHYFVPSLEGALWHNIKQSDAVAVENPDVDLNGHTLTVGDNSIDISNLETITDFLTYEGAESDTVYGFLTTGTINAKDYMTGIRIDENAHTLEHMSDKPIFSLESTDWKLSSEANTDSTYEIGIEIGNDNAVKVYEKNSPENYIDIGYRTVDNPNHVSVVKNDLDNDGIIDYYSIVMHSSDNNPDSDGNIYVTHLEKNEDTWSVNHVNTQSGEPIVSNISNLYTNSVEFKVSKAGLPDNPTHLIYDFIRNGETEISTEKGVFVHGVDNNGNQVLYGAKFDEVNPLNGFVPMDKDYNGFITDSAAPITYHEWNQSNDNPFDFAFTQMGSNQYLVEYLVNGETVLGNPHRVIADPDHVTVYPNSDGTHTVFMYANGKIYADKIDTSLPQNQARGLNNNDPLFDTASYILDKHIALPIMHHTPSFPFDTK